MGHETPPIRIAEARALEAARAISGKRILTTTLGRAQAACALAGDRPHAEVVCWLLDEHLQRLAAAACGEAPNLSLELCPDAPHGAVDLAVVPLPTRGEAELARDLIQSSWQRLDVDGTLVTAVDNPHDRWVREQLRAWFDKVRVAWHDNAAVYTARKDAVPRKVKDFRCEFAFRDYDRLLRAVSRPGVFSHRRVDPGARQLLGAVDVGAGRRVLEIGCGSGVASIALAARDPSIAVHAVDSHVRAVECTLAGAALNRLTNVTAEVNSSGEYGRPDRFDVAVANPPYFGNFEIAQRFLHAARVSLKPEGRVWIVTKSPDWYREFMPAAWTGVELWESKSYWIVTAMKPRE
jgi:16S rRNA (guanine1207-N2)-methyltransferase